MIIDLTENIGKVLPDRIQGYKYAFAFAFDFSITPVQNGDTINLYRLPFRHMCFQVINRHVKNSSSSGRFSVGHDAVFNNFIFFANLDNNNFPNNFFPTNLMPVAPGDDRDIFFTAEDNISDGILELYFLCYDYSG